MANPDFEFKIPNSLVLMPFYNLWGKNFPGKSSVGWASLAVPLSEAYMCSIEELLPIKERFFVGTDDISFERFKLFCFRFILPCEKSSAKSKRSVFDTMMSIIAADYYTPDVSDKERKNFYATPRSCLVRSSDTLDHTLVFETFELVFPINPTKRIAKMVYQDGQVLFSVSWTEDLLASVDDVLSTLGVYRPDPLEEQFDTHI